MEDEELSAGSTSTAFPITDIAASGVQAEVALPSELHSLSAQTGNSTVHSRLHGDSARDIHQNSPAVPGNAGTSPSQSRVGTAVLAQHFPPCQQPPSSTSHSQSKSADPAVLHTEEAEAASNMGWHHHQDLQSPAPCILASRPQQGATGPWTQPELQQPPGGQTESTAGHGAQHVDTASSSMATSAGEHDNSRHRPMQEVQWEQRPGQSQAFQGSGQNGQESIAGQDQGARHDHELGQGQGQGLMGNPAFQQELQQRASRRQAARAGGLHADSARELAGQGSDTNSAQAVR